MSTMNEYIYCLWNEMGLVFIPIILFYGVLLITSFHIAQVAEILTCLPFMQTSSLFNNFFFWNLIQIYLIYYINHVYNYMS